MIDYGNDFGFAMKVVKKDDEDSLEEEERSGLYEPMVNISGADKNESDQEGDEQANPDLLPGPAKDIEDGAGNSTIEFEEPSKYCY